MSLSAEKNEPCQTCEFQENLKILREIYFFSEIPIESLKVFAYLCTREKFREGDYLFTQDDDDGQAFYIISGSADLIYSHDGVDQIIRSYEPGIFSGGLTLLGNTRRLFSMRATTEMVCLILSRDKFSRAMEQFPALMPGMFQSIVDGIRQWEEQFLADRSKECVSCQKKIGVSLL
ncbi:MAG: Crp/Fnr family transcriptional regulator [Desulfatirhabdiaceae bacterium]